jgi:Dyp-type peroxidase family
MFLAATLALIMGAKAGEVRLEISRAQFTSSSVHLPAGAVLRLVNLDDELYTVESPGAFRGDVLLKGHSEAVVKMLRGGAFVAMIEEHPDSEVRLDVDDDPNAPPSTAAPFDEAKSRGLQPLDSEGRDPGYGAITQFDLAVKGQAARQALLMDLYSLEEELSTDQPPPDFALYFSAAEWTAVKSSVAMVYGLGASTYDARRFGKAVAATKPKGLHDVRLPAAMGLNAKDTGQRDVLVRVTSDSAWFNLRVCRLIWRRLGSKISNKTLEWGYAGPNGRSPILGGFYDGTGNPSGAERTRAIFGPDGTAMLAIYRIRFDEDRFLAKTQAQQETAIGRQKISGKPQHKPNPLAHKNRANDGHSTIVRMPLIFDDGSRGTGLLFLATERSFDPLEAMLGRMAAGAGDPLMKFMHFESAAYYAIPPSPKGEFPGSLRTHAFTFGS